MERPLTPPLLADDFLCAEVHLIQRIKDEMPEVNGAVFSENDLEFTDEGFTICPRRSPHILVQYADPLIESPQQLSAGQQPYYQQYEVAIGVRLPPNRCTGEEARRKAGPIISHLVGVPRIHRPAALGGGRDGLGGVVPGWSPTVQHEAFTLVSGPLLRMVENETVIYLVLRFQTQIAIAGAADGIEC